MMALRIPRLPKPVCAALALVALAAAPGLQAFPGAEASARLPGAGAGPGQEPLQAPLEPRRPAAARQGSGFWTGGAAGALLGAAGAFLYSARRRRLAGRGGRGRDGAAGGTGTAGTAGAQGNEDALRASEQRWIGALEGAGHGVWDWDTETGTVYFSRQWKAMLGHGEDEVGNTLSEWSSRVHPEDMPACQEALDRHFSGGAPAYRCVHRLRCKDGSYRWILDRGTVFEWAAPGRPRRVVGTHTDITEQKHDEEALRASEARARWLNQMLRSIRAVNQLLVRGGTPQELIDGVCRELAERLDFHVWVGLVDGDGRVTAHAVSRGHACREALDARFEAGRLPACGADSLGTDTLRRIREPDPECATGAVPGAPQHDVRLSYRLAHKGRVYGTMVAVVPRKLGEDPDVAALFRELAGDLSLALDNLESEAARQASEALYAELVNNTPVGIFQSHSSGRFLYVNPATAALLGWESPEAAVAAYRDLGAELYVDPSSRLRLLAALRRRGAVSNFEIEIRARDGTRKWLLLNARAAAHQPDGSFTVDGFANDVTDRKRSEAALRQAAKVFESTQEGVMITGPDARVLAVNRAFTEITGYAEDEVRGRRPGFLKSGRHDRTFYQAMWRAIHEAGSWQGEIWNRRRDGSIYPELLTIDTVKDETGQVVNYIGISLDITQRKHSEERLAFLAHNDALTGLPNRLLFTARLEHALARAEREQGRLYVLLIDLDRFKHVNDSLGHTVGDQVLEQVAVRLRQAVRRDDTVARMGGDEFAVLLERVTTKEHAERMAAKLIRILDRSFTVQAREIMLGGSIGISVYPEDGTSAEELLRNADAAMYRAKELGRSTYELYAESMTRQAMDQVTLHVRLRRAIENEELVLHYQPQVALPSRTLIGVEALVRWHDPREGLIPPGRFIPVAEESGLIKRLGAWVLHQACAQGRRWLDDGVAFGRVAVNVAADQIDMDFPEAVRRVLAETGLPPACLELEITESAMMKAQGAAALLGACRELGVGLAIDDFGTGYSSLAYLKTFPVSKLKVDRSFVRGLPEDQSDVEIVRTIHALGRNLGFQVLAEGIETAAQQDFLVAEGYSQAQGYLYGKPRPPEEIFAHPAPALGQALEEDVRTAGIKA